MRRRRLRQRAADVASAAAASIWSQAAADSGRSTLSGRSSSAVSRCTRSRKPRVDPVATCGIGQSRTARSPPPLASIFRTAGLGPSNRATSPPAVPYHGACDLRWQPDTRSATARGQRCLPRSQATPLILTCGGDAQADLLLDHPRRAGFGLPARGRRRESSERLANRFGGRRWPIGRPPAARRLREQPGGGVRPLERWGGRVECVLRRQPLGKRPVQPRARMPRGAGLFSDMDEPT